MNASYTKCLAVACFILCLLIPNFVIADVKLLYYKNEISSILISGEISPKDINLFNKYTKLLKLKFVNSPIEVKLNSIGGHVGTALKIGRKMREINAMAVIAENDRCLSACVFILAGAPYRYIGGEVGIHRPNYPASYGTSPNSQKQTYLQVVQLGKVIRQFLSEMNVKPELYDDMFYISPENMKILSVDELQSYGLYGNDPFIEGADAALDAKGLGISRVELAKRTAKIKRVCTPLYDVSYPDAFKKCYTDVLQGRR